MKFLPILLQMGTEASQKENKPFSVLDAILEADKVVQITLGILILFSIISWAIIFFKYFQLKKAKQSSGKFAQLFNQSYTLDEVLTKSSPQDGNPLYKIFSSGISEILRVKQRKAQDPNYKIDLSLGHIEKNIQRAKHEETNKLEQLTPFLATTASTAPFIGLFGTVWGILGSFASIAESNGAGFEVVGPKISEALVATAVGLAAAIPAVMAYNYFVARIRNRRVEMNDFSEDLTQRISKEYF